MTKSEKSRQQLACDYIHDQYVAFNRLRFDLIAQKVQVRCADCNSLGDEATGLSGDRPQWRYITNADINTMVCDCCAETGASITSKEILTVLNAGEQYIPRVHPLREYVHSLPAYTPDQPDWIDFVAQQVKVKDNNEEGNKQQPKQHNNNNSAGAQHTPAARGESFNDKTDNFLSHPEGSNDYYRPNQLSRATGDIDLKQLQNNSKNNLFRSQQLSERQEESF